MLGQLEGFGVDYISSQVYLGLWCISLSLDKYTQNEFLWVECWSPYQIWRVQEGCHNRLCFSHVRLLIVIFGWTWCIWKKESLYWYNISKALSEQATSKSTNKKELLAWVLAIQRWRPYLLGKPFSVQTNQKGLKYLLNQWIYAQSIKVIDKIIRIQIWP